MNNYLLLFCVLLLNSCQFFDKKKLSVDEIVNQEIKSINWDEVDEYPSFSVCDSINEKTGRIECFYSEFHKRILSNLERQNLVSNQIMIDTINVFFEINKSGKLTVQKLDFNPKIKEIIPNLDSLIRISISQVKDVSPAIKRGQPVKISLEMPLLITNKN